MMPRNGWIALVVCVLCLPRSVWAVPAMEEVRLENGLRVLLMEAHNVPMVSMSILLPAGSRFDGMNQGGTASLLASMLTDHTRHDTHEQWSKRLDREAIQLSAYADKEALSVSVTVLKDVMPLGVNLLADVLLSPGWNSERFQQIKEDAIAAAQKAEEEPGVQAAEAAASLLFDGHPYGHRASGNRASLANIQLADLKRLYGQQCLPTGSVLAVSGDVTMAELLAWLQPALASWRGAPEIALENIAVPGTVQGQQQQIRMQTSQTLVQLLRLGPSRLHKDFFPVFVLNHILGGGGFSSRLMEEVREKRGLVYGVYSYFVPLVTRGPFVISLQTRANQAEFATSVVQDVLQDLYTHGVTEQQLEAAKANLVGGFAQRMDSNRERVGLMAMIGFYGLPLDYLQTWQSHVAAVSVADIQQAARDYLNPKEWNTIYVGPSSPAPALTAPDTNIQDVNAH